jgi:acyl-coenzyme A synthetase/AMP-(fatty) acid ligase
VSPVNFAAELFRRSRPQDAAIISVGRTGERRTVSFAEIDDASARLASRYRALGVRRGDVVMTVMGNSPHWAQALMACFRIGAVALPCVTQSRGRDLALRGKLVEVALIVTTEELADGVAAAGLDVPIVVLPDPSLAGEPPAPYADMRARDPALIIFTSGTSGPPKAVVHGVRYLFGQALQAEHWYDARPGDIAWCTAAAGWSKSARNAFIAPWLRGATAVLHDARFDPQQRVELVRELAVTALCMSPTEYRMVLRRAEIPPLPALRSAVAAGEAMEAATVAQWRAATSTWLRDGYGQTETGAITTHLPGAEPRAGSMGRPLRGIAVHVDQGQLMLDPGSTETFFLGYRGLPAPAGPWATGDLVEQDEDGYLWFKSRADDVILSAGYRIGPAEVEAALLSHPAVAEVAVVGHPDAERGQIVRAIVVLADGRAPSDALVLELQDHAKERTAPYKHPRVVEFAAELPRTASGKIMRAALRA